MAAAATPFVSWISATAGLAGATGTQAKAAVAAYEAAFAMTLRPRRGRGARVRGPALILAAFGLDSVPEVGWCGCARFRTFAVMLADQVTARQIERVDHMERDDERYPTTVEGSVRLIDSY